MEITKFASALVMSGCLPFPSFLSLFGYSPSSFSSSRSICTISFFSQFFVFKSLPVYLAISHIYLNKISIFYLPTMSFLVNIFFFSFIVKFRGVKWAMPEIISVLT